LLWLINTSTKKSFLHTDYTNWSDLVENCFAVEWPGKPLGKVHPNNKVMNGVEGTETLLCYWFVLSDKPEGRMDGL